MHSHNGSSHISWIESLQDKDVRNIESNLLKFQSHAKTLNKQYAKHKIQFQHSLIPVIDINSASKSGMKKCIYDMFFKERGAIILKNVFSSSQMDKLNEWSVKMLTESKSDKNAKHRKQSHKWLINDVITRMARTNPDLLLQTVFDDNLNNVMDNLLGFARIGSCTMHWIESKGDRQQSHVDYPIHVGTGSMWENNVELVKKWMTSYQINKIMPYYSIQVLVAVDKMNESNGSTEVVPCSHLLHNMDTIIHDKQTYDMMEKHFINVELDQGDVLIFNRRLCHRGGCNMSNDKRNALIIQSVFLWGIGQEIIDHDKIVELMKQSSIFKKMKKEQKENLMMRIKQPYPINVKNDA